jgi:RHS repeat-associated protein
VVERFLFDPYGVATFLDPDWATDAGGSDYARTHLHQGGHQDPLTGLVHFRFRDYSPTLGRWTQQDPAGYIDGPSRYQALRSNPTSYVDPLGLRASGLTQEQHAISPWAIFRHGVDGGIYDDNRNVLDGNSLSSEDITGRQDWLRGKTIVWHGVLDGCNYVLVMYHAGTDQQWREWLWGGDAGPGLAEEAFASAAAHDAANQTLKQTILETIDEYATYTRDGLLGGIGGMVLGAAKQVGQGAGPLAGPSPRIDMGKQGKHVVGHSNYIPGRSILTADPTDLGLHAGTGQSANGVLAGKPGAKERIDFGRVIGVWWVDRGSGAGVPTTKGLIHYSANGIHVVPARP